LAYSGLFSGFARKLVKNHDDFSSANHQPGHRCKLICTFAQISGKIASRRFFHIGLHSGKSVRFFYAQNRIKKAEVTL